MPKLSAAERLDLYRRLGRPSVHDYIPLMFKDFVELHGDRCFGDDPALLGGIGLLEGVPVTLLATVRGRTIEEFVHTNFSMPLPEGYRKALRLAKQAEKFHRPVVCLVDTPGAFCGIGAEERGQAASIAQCLKEFSTLKTPLVSVILGEANSGGALALCVCDELAMLENALYSVISPRGFASIVWGAEAKGESREKEAAALLRITAEDMLSFGVCDRILPEGEAACADTARVLTDYLSATIKRLSALELDALLERRFARYCLPSGLRDN
jgi:acetyl-CoA carboxylase carboxyl transferase subunit alpha